MSTHASTPARAPAEAIAASGAPFEHDVVVVGGCGHVGLPLGIALGECGMRVALVDTNQAAVDIVNEGRLPFDEDGAEAPLASLRAASRLMATTSPEVIAGAEYVVVVIGTPVDEHLNPDPNAIPIALEACKAYFRDGQLLVLRSTVYPGVTALVQRMLSNLGVDIPVAFCPERIAEHKAMTELFSLPQIVSSHSASGRRRAAELFSRLTEKIVELEPEEAELAKLFTNTWRYIKFAAANQFYMIANDRGLDFEKIRAGLSEDYPRARDLPGAGFAAGPCLFKDTMQLAAFSDNTFNLGHSAMLVNEGLPLYLVSRLERRFPLEDLTVGILGMAFKAESDDIRSSLSYKLRRALKFKAKAVLSTDPYVTEETDDTLLPLQLVLEKADLLVIAAPHSEYRSIKTDKPVADVWNVLGNGVVI